MNFLFFDTETTGKFDKKRPKDWIGQPRIVQLGAILTNGEGEEIARMCRVVKPEGFRIPQEMGRIHRITQALAEKEGIPLREVMEEFRGLSQETEVMVGHNVEFDLTMVEREGYGRLVDKMISCTMTRMIPICKLPGLYGDYKYPSLQEAYNRAFGRGIVGAHDALVDVQATKELFFWLEKNHPVGKGSGV